MARALEGLTVLEVSRGMPGSLAAMILADHGADVIKAESPSGDPYLSEAGRRVWGRGKRRLGLNLDLPAERESVFALAHAADVIICGVRPVTAERWGLTYAALAKGNPRLIFASISGFGWDGPLRHAQATEGLVAAVSGFMTMPSGGRRHGPTFFAPPLSSYAAALLAVQGILAALRDRDRTGSGQHVETSLYRGGLVYRAAFLWSPDRHAEDFPPPVAQPSDSRGVRPLFNLNECADGRWLSMGAWTPALAYKALESMGLTELLADARFAGLPNFFTQEAHRQDLLTLLWDAFKSHPLQHWLDLFDAA